MSKAREQFTLQASFAECVAACAICIEQFNWNIYEATKYRVVCGEIDELISAWANPAEIEIVLKPISESKTNIILNSSNWGFGPIQDEHVRKLVTNLRAAIENDIAVSDHFNKTAKKPDTQSFDQFADTLSARPVIKQQNVNNAIAEAKKILDDAEKSLGQEHPVVADALKNYAYLLEQTGESPEKIQELYTRASQILGEVPSPTSKSETHQSQPPQQPKTKSEGPSPQKSATPDKTQSTRGPETLHVLREEKEPTTISQETLTQNRNTKLPKALIKPKVNEDSALAKRLLLIASIGLIALAGTVFFLNQSQESASEVSIQPSQVIKEKENTKPPQVASKVSNPAENSKSHPKDSQLPIADTNQSPQSSQSFGLGTNASIESKISSNPSRNPRTESSLGQLLNLKTNQQNALTEQQQTSNQEPDKTLKESESESTTRPDPALVSLQNQNRSLANQIKALQQSNIKTEMAVQGLREKLSDSKRLVDDRDRKIEQLQNNLQISKENSFSKDRAVEEMRKTLERWKTGDSSAVGASTVDIAYDPFYAQSLSLSDFEEYVKKFPSKYAAFQTKKARAEADPRFPVPDPWNL